MSECNLIAKEWPQGQCCCICAQHHRLQNHDGEDIGHVCVLFQLEDIVQEWPEHSTGCECFIKKDYLNRLAKNGDTNR